ncbi:MAG TPA: GGDEF domain-containing protein, partial [Candidatus Accumulibacter sp.]|nr:GGDEF domain-containing protein [Accumulibacter sp.]
MAKLSNPSEIAREALRLLAVRRLSPSPDNYRALYNEIAGTDPGEALPHREFRALLASLPQETLAQQRMARRLEQAFAASNWQQLGAGLSDLVRQVGKEQELPWNELLGDFLREWENKQAGLTVARKREALERVLASGSSGAEVLFARLQGLVKSWSAGSPAGEDMPLLTAEPVETATSQPQRTAEGAAETADGEGDSPAQLRNLFAYLLEALTGSQLANEPELAADARALVHKVRTASSRGGLEDLLAGIKRFAFRLELLAEDRAELRAGLLKLLQLLLENVGELVVEDRWLRGQIDIVRDIVAEPLNVR